MSAGRYESVVLAGGLGARFGGDKLLVPYQGGKLVHGALRAALAAPVERAVVVTGHQHGAIGSEVVAFCAHHQPEKRVDVIYAQGYASGLSVTLKAGVAALSNKAAGMFVFLGDMPEVPSDIAGRLIHALEAADADAAAPVSAGRRGHPVLIHRRVFPQLLALEGDRGARAVLDRLGDRLVAVAVEAPGVLFDVDRPEDITL